MSERRPVFPRRAWLALFLTALSPLSARAATRHQVEIDRAELGERMDALRPLVEPQERNDDERHSQWGNWPNWFNGWNDWRNRRNW